MKWSQATIFLSLCPRRWGGYLCFSDGRNGWRIMSLSARKPVERIWSWWIQLILWPVPHIDWFISNSTAVKEFTNCKWCVSIFQWGILKIQILTFDILRAHLGMLQDTEQTRSGFQRRISAAVAESSFSLLSNYVFIFVLLCVFFSMNNNTRVSTKTIRLKLPCVPQKHIHDTSVQQSRRLQSVRSARALMMEQWYWYAF